MAKRFTDTEIWDKEWFMSLSPKLKCLVRFVYDKCDVAGIWSPNWTLASSYIGQKITISDLKEIKGQFEILPDGKIFVVSFVNFQYGDLSEKCKPHIKVINILKKHDLLQRVSKGYTYPIQRVEDMDKDKEEDKEEEKEEDKEKEIPEPIVLIPIIYPFDTENFKSAWDTWKKYKEEAWSFKYKTFSTEQAALKSVSELSGGDEKKAIHLIHYSIKNQWKGIFQDKEYGKQQQQNTGSGKQNGSFNPTALAELHKIHNEFSKGTG